MYSTNILLITNHQGLDNTIPFPTDEVENIEGDIQTKDRIDGLLKYYYRDAV